MKRSCYSPLRIARADDVRFMAALKDTPLREAQPTESASESFQGIAIDLDQLFASKQESGGSVTRTPNGGAASRNGSIHISEEEVLSDLLRKDAPSRPNHPRRGKQWSSKSRRNNH